MATILHITNGDCAVEIMKKAGLQGDFLPWRDILHEGPVPAGYSLKALSQIRAEYIANTVIGAGDLATITHSFRLRDEQFQTLAQYHKIVLWFEHDLYDQLQLLQILSETSLSLLDTTKMGLICTEHYLGRLKPQQLLDLQQFEQPVCESHIQMAKSAWQAFCAPVHKDWQALQTTQNKLFEFLPDAVTRMLQQYPDSNHGLCRVGFEALKIVAMGGKSPVELFALYQRSEPRQFLGDSSFCTIVNQLLEAQPPLITHSERKLLETPLNESTTLTISAFGEQVLAGAEHALNAIGIDRWIGGVHLSQNNLWYWNKSNSALEQPSGLKRDERN